ncbi:MAG: protease inhibitor I42 family protein [Proteobacteria bacterium]|nr:protease inhibitor I42 family protein [Pseudomonadota bacterium]
MAEPVALTEANQAQTIGVKAGDLIRLSLPENATTGYRWAVDRLGSGIEQVGAPEASYPAGAVGSGGRASWMFKATAPGVDEIAMKMWRPWEGEPSVVQRFHVWLNIAP